MTGQHLNPITLRHFIRENPNMTTRQIATHFNALPNTISRHIRRAGIVHIAKGKQKPVLCREPLFQLFATFARMGLSDAAVASALGVSHNLVSAWRTAQREPTFFNFEGLCEIANVKIKLEGK